MNMKKLKVFIIYFPIILVACQVILNMASFVFPQVYSDLGFYLNLFFGTNVLFAAFLVAFTWMFRFCAISRYAAIAQVLFALNYMIVQQDNLYNILFQITVGFLAMMLTARHYSKKFPLCNLSLIVMFFKSAVKERSCRKGLHRFDREIDHILKQQKPGYARR